MQGISARSKNKFPCNIVFHTTGTRCRLRSLFLRTHTTSLYARVPATIASVPQKAVLHTTSGFTRNMPPPTSNRHRRHELLSIRPTLHPGQSICRVIRACGENIYEVQDARGTHSLFQLPKRLRHVAFIKRGSFVFVRVDETRRDSRVRGDIEAVVLDRFLASLKNEPFWPALFAKNRHGQEGAQGGNEWEIGKERDGEQWGQEEGEAEDGWEIGSGNPNRRRWDHVSSDEDSDSS